MLFPFEICIIYTPMKYSFFKHLVRRFLHVYSYACKKNSEYYLKILTCGICIILYTLYIGLSQCAEVYTYWNYSK